MSSSPHVYEQILLCEIAKAGARDRSVVTTRGDVGKIIEPSAVGSERTQFACRLIFDCDQALLNDAAQRIDNPATNAASTYLS